MSQTTASPVDELDAPTLTAFDRCDSCGAQAYVKVTLASGELLFCAHHGAKFKEKLSPQAIAWHDESDRLHAAKD
jgi:hypothetical protein